MTVRPACCDCPIGSFSCSLQNLANMAWAYDKLNHDAPMLLNAIGVSVTKIVGVGPASSVQMLLMTTGWL